MDGLRDWSQLSGGTDARSTHMKRAKQSQDSPLGFLECRKSPAIGAHSVKETVRNQKRSKI